MVISWNGNLKLRRSMKEFLTPISLRRSILSSSSRVAELPSLRYGSVGSKSVLSGPLRLVSRRHLDCITPLRTASTTKPLKHPQFDTDDGKKPPVRPARRVRFTLPPAEDVGASAAAAAAAVSPERRRRVQQVRPLNINNNDLSPSSPSDGLGDSEASVVLVSSSPGVRIRVHPTGQYVRGTLSPTSNSAATPHAAAPTAGLELLRAARDGDEQVLRELVRKTQMVGIATEDLNAVDGSGRTIFSYVASNGPVDILEKILSLPGLDYNRPDNEGNTPLHFAAQAGQVECLNCILSKCAGIEIDARNNLGFTPLMKAALQGRNKCAKLLLFAGANPTLRDNGRGFRADQWARFCGRYVCADVIEKHARQRLLERSTSYGNWGVENEIGARMLLGKVVPMPPVQTQTERGIKSKLRKVFRTSSGPNHSTEHSSARLVTQLTSAALCASTPVLPTASNVPPVVKSLIRPLTVPRLQITLVSNGNVISDAANANLSATSTPEVCKESEVIKPNRKKK